jgi:hypothetical protein
MRLTIRVVKSLGSHDSEFGDSSLVRRSSISPLVSIGLYYQAVRLPDFWVWNMVGLTVFSYNRSP